MRKPLYAANWKMHKTMAETKAFFAAFLPQVTNRTDGDICIAPPYTSLVAGVEATAGSGVIIAAQNCYHEAKGAFTGELSLDMIRETGATAVIIGHSERRHVFGENDALINKKIIAACDAGITPIFCIGEKIEQREAGETEAVLVEQIRAGLASLTAQQMSRVEVAYEPVWAIGTGKTATPEIAQEAHETVRSEIGKMFGDELAGTIRILYGGSVKPGNISELMAKPDIDGVLVGGASLDPDSFAAIAAHAG